MYEIKENRRKLFDGTEITTYTRDVVSANILQVEAGTTGYKGGDTGHGGRTYFRISDEASTDIHVTPRHFIRHTATTRWTAMSMCAARQIFTLRWRKPDSSG